MPSESETISFVKSDAAQSAAGDNDHTSHADHIPLFKPTTTEETFGCLKSTVGTVSLEAMDEAVMREAKKHRT
jgi:hypothetical protein